MSKGIDNRRVERFEKEVKEQVASYLLRGLNPKPSAIVTVTRVIMPGDLKSAKVYVSVMGEAQVQEEVIDLLQDQAGEIQHHLAKTIQARFCPKLKFFLDDTFDELLKVDSLLHKLSKDQKS